MEDPNPIAITPPILQSLNPVAENPTICAQQPTVAAPADIPVKFNIIHKAVLERGDVKTSPTMVDTMIPMKFVSFDTALPNSEPTMAEMSENFIFSYPILSLLTNRFKY